MAGDEVKKEKKEKKDKDPSEKKEKKDKGDKDKKDKKDKEPGEKKHKEHKEHKDGAAVKHKDGKHSAGGAGDAKKAPPPAPRAPPPRPPPPVKRAAKAAPGDDYLAGLDLPPSEEEEEEVERREFDKGPLMVQASDRETKKLADKERMAMEKALRAKADALREDENVFDVAFEGMGTDEPFASATDVKVTNLTIRAKGKVLLENTSLTIAAGRRYGLAGPNGKGKSTLLKLMARRQIPVPENIDVLLVEQEVVGMDDQTALQAVVAADVELMELRVEEQQLQDSMTAEEHDAVFDMDEASARLNEIYDRMNELGASTAESRASKILHGLGFTPAMQKRATSSFSGGWRMRISLARALYIQPTLLLLDEPTNHLDLRAVLWLEEYLMRWKKTLIVVSHDRDFLNSVTTDIIHLHDLKLHFYRGNFAQFEEMYEQKRREVNKAFEKYEKQMKAAKQSGKNSKANQEKVLANAQRQQAKRGGGRKAEPVDDAGASSSNAPQRWSDYSVSFHFPEPTELPPPLMQLVDADFKYPGRDDFGLSCINIGIDMGSRVAIAGPNGAGKTTLMNLLSGDLEPTCGESRRSHKLRIGRYNQHFVDALAFDENPVEYLMNKFPEAGLKPEGMRGMLGRFGLSGHHHLTPIIKLSGGQKARVVFTAIALSRPHILLLDEPTNHLDMQSIDALCDALDEFQGGVVVISHDSQLLSRLCADEERSEVWIVDDGKITFYNGDFDDYRNELVKEINAELDEDDE
ncbi:ABCF4 [Scenedesmus sp. PABB004]|nr:ABCF4 [Scenedesmus sp. PABB004]